MKILVSVFNNLYTDQRVEKVCRTLHENGYEIELIGNTWDGEPEMQRPYKFHRIPLKSKILRSAYLEFNHKLYSELKRRITRDTILLSNDLDTLLPNYLLSKKFKIPLVFDSHEIFTEQPSVQGRWVQKVWRKLERSIVPKLSFMMTESESYANWFQEKYGIKPVVIRNVPKKINEEISFPENQPKIILYQGALNHSRGLIQAISAIKLVDNVIFKIAGDGNLRQKYEQHSIKENLQNKVEFLGRLNPENLRNLTKTADVGFAVEENGGISYYFSLPNKVPDYIQSQVPMVMIDFPEIAKIAEKYSVGEMIENHHPETIAEAIKKVLKNGRNFYKEDLKKAAAEYCWEHEEAKILALFHEVGKQKIMLNFVK